MTNAQRRGMHSASANGNSVNISSQIREPKDQTSGDLSAMAAYSYCGRTRAHHRMDGFSDLAAVVAYRFPGATEKSVRLRYSSSVHRMNGIDAAADRRDGLVNGGLSELKAVSTTQICALPYASKRR